MTDRTTAQLEVDRLIAALTRDEVFTWQRDLVTAFASQVASREQARVHDLLLWANEYIVEPDYFPNEGDRQLWKETRDGLPTK